LNDPEPHKGDDDQQKKHVDHTPGNEVDHLCLAALDSVLRTGC
jgi:hypothetical protein